MLFTLATREIPIRDQQSARPMLSTHPSIACGRSAAQISQRQRRSSAKVLSDLAFDGLLHINFEWTSETWKVGTAQLWRFKPAAAIRIRHAVCRGLGWVE
jgi:hypothetical protein